MPPPDRNQHLRELFARAADLPTDRRAAFVQRECPDPSLRAELESLLAVAEHDSGAFFDDPLLARSPAGAGVIPEPERGTPVLEDLEHRMDHRPEVRLRDGAGPPARERDDASSRLGKYAVGESIGTGGVGEVVRGRDSDLGREIALKFLREEHRGRPSIVRRFVEEAQIGSQLQHPGIVPVYDLGMAADHRPFFAMKLVRGATLAAMLAERDTPSSDRQRFVQIFLQVAQTVAYAHAKGVIHRDLKPANVMVGRYGEVQVVDWGLGKVLEREGEPSTDPDAHDIDTNRRDTLSDVSMPGSILGTPAYMPPEQASGSADGVGAHSDVFGLGAMLCEILTGRPPYASPDTAPARQQAELVAMAARGDLGDARARLAQCDADPKLVSICLDCLSPAAEARPQDAAIVAERIVAHFARIEATAHTARVEAAVARRKRQLSAVITGVVLAGLIGTAGLWWSTENARAAADRARTDAMEQERLATRLGEEVVRETANIERQQQRVRTAKARADAENARFRLLGYQLQFDEAEAAAAELFPAWPRNAERLANWLNKAETLVGRLDEVRAARDALRAIAIPATEADDVRVVAFRQQHVEPCRGWFEAQRDAAAVRAGAAAAAAELDDVTQSLPLRDLQAFVWARTAPDRGARRVWHEQALALAAARHLVARATAEGSENLAEFTTNLAFALYANGLDDEALDRMRTALSLDDSDWFQRSLQNLEGYIRWWSGDDGAAERDRLAVELAGLERRALDERDWQFEENSDRYLHGSLQTLVRGLERIDDIDEADGVHAVRRRLDWAERVGDLTIERHRDAWERARIAIMAADGSTASALYASEPPLELMPQTGLVPLGMNPATQLWEFYHLRSAWDPSTIADPADVPIPQHDPETGDIPVDGGTGIVLVLVPGGTFMMGSRPGEDPNPQDSQLEFRRSVTLPPYFIARHELTQGQWLRLGVPSNPSRHQAGFQAAWMDAPAVTLAHPVQNVSQTMCLDLLNQHGLVLPTETGWERACRAGSDERWHSGDEPASLEGCANLLDLHAKRNTTNGWGTGDPMPWDDGHVIHAPVGSYRPNAFGLFDMHGNVNEWCDGRIGASATSEDVLGGAAVIRGGSYFENPRYARSANRGFQKPSARYDNIGLRAARSIEAPE